ncbi:hypothetical protein V8C42DRAFT_359707 [Trichoderma barbatum]
MIDKLQCQTHTRTPWGKNPHYYDHRIRYLVMGLLCTAVLTIFIVSLVFIGDRAIKNYQLTPPDDGPTTLTEPISTLNGTNPSTNNTTNTTANAYPSYYKTGKVS